MFKNPFANAVYAGLYIILIITLMHIVQAVKSDMPDNEFLAPLSMLGLFTLSAAVMGYLFLANPLQLYLDGHKKEAVAFFGKTVGTFAAIVVISFTVMLLM